MRRLVPALAFALAVALPARADDTDLPPPPPPPAYDPVPLPPPPSGTERREAPPRPSDRPYRAGDRERERDTRERDRRDPARTPRPKERKPGTIGDGPVAPAGAQAAQLHPDEAISHWRLALASGVVGRFGGYTIDSDRENSRIMLYLGGQADGLWTEGFGQAARFRFWVMVGGESEIFIPSDGDVEAAYMIGRPEFRFVLGRFEATRFPGLALQVLLQGATLPSIEGSIPLGNDSMRLSYFVAPVEIAWLRYYGGAHIQHSAAWTTETNEPAAASAGRLRYTVLLPPSVVLSLEGDLVKFWSKADLLFAAEGSLGYQALEQSVLFNVAMRYQSLNRRGTAPETTASASELSLMAIATLVF